MARAKKALDCSAQTLMKSLLSDQEWLHYGALIWKSTRLNSPDELLIRALRSALRACGGNQEFPELGQVEDLYGALCSPKFAGATLGGCRLIRIRHDDDPAVLICREHTRVPIGPTPIRTHQDVIWDHRFVIRCDNALHALTVRKCDRSSFCALTTKGGTRFRQLPSEILQSLPVVCLGERPIAAPDNVMQAFAKCLTVRFMVNRFMISADNGN